MSSLAAEPENLEVVKPLSDLQEGAVYGPIHSRRLGYSLGINPLPASYKFCDFDCVYCQYGWTPSKGTGEKIKRAAELLSEIRASFISHKSKGTPVNCLTIAGNGEPTLHPDFPEFIEGLIQLRNEFYPGVRIGILSDSTQAHRPEISAALAKIEERYMKLDAGDEAKVREINRPRGNYSFERTVSALASMKNIVVQSLFLQGSYNNWDNDVLEKWAAAIAKIQPDEVQVYTLDRGTPAKGLLKVSREKLREIAQFCERKTGIKAVVF